MSSNSQSPWFDGLTEPQAEAVATTEGPVLILAAAGSGKTRVITRRIAYLLSLGVPAWQILALTFTNKAAGEMRERVDRLLEAESRSRGLTITTFHALCARLLRRYAPLMEHAPRWGIKGDYTIYDTDDQTALIKRVISDIGVSTSNWPPRSVLAQISATKNALQDASAFAATHTDFHGRMLARLYDGYEKALRAANAVDFDDLLMLTVRLLKENDEARQEVQSRWKYLMIDEYQDTNHAQFLLSTLLVGETEVGTDPESIEGLPGIDEPPAAPNAGSRVRNVCVVGDPDQSIYGWRGADIANILDFEEQYPGARVIKLGQNFRSTAPILKAADTLIKRNRKRKDKPLFTANEGGEPPNVILSRDEHHEAAVVLDWMKRLREEGTGPEGGGLAWRDFAVFYRNNSLSRVIEDTLRQEGVPYLIVRGTAFYDREEVRDAIAYLRVIANPADEVSLRRIVNKPARKIGGTSLEKAAEFAASSDLTLFEALRRAGEVPGLTPSAASAMRAFVDLVDEWSGGGSFMGASVASSLSDLVGRVISESGLEAHYRAAKTKGGDEDVERLANLEEVVTSARDFDERYDPASDAAMDVPRADAPPPAPPLLALLRAYLERVSLVADADAIDPTVGAVTLMTLHAAKGLEFPAVAMIGLEEGLLPSARALESEPEGEPEEERRLCFVGITRAMRRLLMTCAKYRSVRGLRERTIPSRFLGELPRDAVIFSDQSESWDDADVDERAPEHRTNRQAVGLRPGNIASPASSRPPKQITDDPQFPIGSKVRHPQFGLGTVQGVTGLGVNRRATVAFLQAGTKTLILQYARLERV